MRLDTLELEDLMQIAYRDKNELAIEVMERYREMLYDLKHNSTTLFGKGFRQGYKEGYEDCKDV